jgi:hypothetical protein
MSKTLNNLGLAGQVALLDNFAQFCSLPSEIRLMIWEETWPEARVIEAAYAEAPGPDESNTEADDELDEYVILRPTCHLSTWVQTTFSHRILEDGPLEECPDPIALQVCHESRIHTLRKYTCMQHSKLSTRAFYLYPGRDIIWLNTDVTDDPIYVGELRHHYSSQLGRIERVLVEDYEWNSTVQNALNNLGIFEGFCTIEVVLDDEDVPEDADLDVVRAKFSQDLIKFRDRDMRALWGLGLTIQYVDRMFTTYSRFMT